MCRYLTKRVLLWLAPGQRGPSLHHPPPAADQRSAIKLVEALAEAERSTGTRAYALAVGLPVALMQYGGLDGRPTSRAAGCRPSHPVASYPEAPEPSPSRGAPVG